MLLVLLIHYTATVDVNQMTLKDEPLLTVFMIELHSLSVLCVNCFILISGYFGITWRTRSFLGLIYQVLFWLLFGILIANLANIDNHSAGVLKTIMTYFGGRWFVPAYLALYIMAPLLNSYIKGVSPRELGRYIIVFYLFSTIVGYLMLSREFNEGMSAISLVGLYLVGAYLKRTDLWWLRLRARWNLAIYVGLSMVLTVSYAVLLSVGINKSPLGYLNPLVIVMSAYLFLFFQRLDIGEVKWINYVAASAFAVYLFHMHPALYGEYQHFCRLITSMGTSAVLLIPCFFVAIFVLSIAVDRVRMYSWALIVKFFKKHA